MIEELTKKLEDVFSGEKYFSFELTEIDYGKKLHASFRCNIGERHIRSDGTFADKDFRCTLTPIDVEACLSGRNFDYLVSDIVISLYKQNYTLITSYGK